MKQVEFRYCDRCGLMKAIEKHHIIHRADGGSDDADNLKDLCTHCYDYQHAKENITEKIYWEEKRLEILKKRLAILEAENTPELIRKRGYQSYFDSYSASLSFIETKSKCKCTDIGKLTEPAPSQSV